MSEVELVVVGGGVTGTAIARDAALRGIKTILVERGAIGSGTSGRFHSMLQSGARYVVTDTDYAAECMRERRIMEQIAPFARTATSGLFVAFEDDDPAFMERFENAASVAGIPIEKLTPAQIAEREPNIAATIGGFTVPDAVFRPWEMVPALAASAIAAGAEILTHTTFVGAESVDGSVSAVRVRGADGHEWKIETASLVIAAGAWAAELGGTVGLDIEVETAKGAMLVLPTEMVNTVVNRLRPPTSFDISVPLNGATVFGTTSSIVERPEDIAVTPEEFDELAIEARRFLPTLGQDTSGWSAYAGVRPLVKASPGEGGAVSRRHAVFEGTVDGAYGIVGGSFTTHRAMAEDVVNRVAALVGNPNPSTTATTTLVSSATPAWAAGAPMQAHGIALAQ
ncbi:FAD-dependent oxidoreductase [Salinibacterium sp. ZJ70]|uniref:FAD-dependent oxidoreductase n=1 Tax=Salinibacterium sp. ZJ70 TaxID=2708084 RepID=UPI00141F0DA6|nr:FAD-dependent oxidoreductase [Salinibacterium sp. ZJ70]